MSPIISQSAGAGGGSQPGVLASQDLLFTEEATAGQYTASLALPSGSVVRQITLYPLSAPWAADAAVLNIGDTQSGDTPPDNYMGGVDLVGQMSSSYDPTSSTPGTSWANIEVASLFASAAAAYQPDGSAGTPVLPMGGSFQQNFAENVRNSGNTGTIEIPVLSTGGPGVRYAADDTITMTIDTTIAVPPVAPQGIMLVKIEYFAAVTAVAASFA